MHGSKMSVDLPRWFVQGECFDRSRERWGNLVCSLRTDTEAEVANGGGVATRMTACPQPITCNAGNA